MKRTTQVLVVLLALLLPLAQSALATENNQDQVQHLRFSQTAVATDTSSPGQPETPLEVLEQVADLISGDRGLAISNSASIILLCDRIVPLDDPDYHPDELGNLGVSLKIRF